MLFRIVIIISIHIALLSLSSLAQTDLDFSELPECAASCTLLMQAQDACAEQIASQELYLTCYCQSAYLQPFYADSPDEVCGNICTDDSDLAEIQSTFLDLCQASDEETTTDSSSSEDSDEETTTDSSSSEDSDEQESETQDSTSDGSWISLHWKWVVMLIVIALILISATVLGVYFKRRHHAKKELLRGNVAATDGPPIDIEPAEKLKFGDFFLNSGRLSTVRETISGWRNRLNTSKGSSGAVGAVMPTTGDVVRGPYQSMPAVHESENLGSSTLITNAPPSSMITALEQTMEDREMCENPIIEEQRPPQGSNDSDVEKDFKKDGQAG